MEEKLVKGLVRLVGKQAKVEREARLLSNNIFRNAFRIHKALQTCLKGHPFQKEVLFVIENRDKFRHMSASLKQVANSYYFTEFNTVFNLLECALVCLDENAVRQDFEALELEGDYAQYAQNLKDLAAIIKSMHSMTVAGAEKMYFDTGFGNFFEQKVDFLISILTKSHDRV